MAGAGGGGCVWAGGEGNGKRGGVRAGRGMRIWDGGGVRGGASGSGSGGSEALEGRGEGSKSGSRASERLGRRAVGSVRAGGGCAASGGYKSAAVCGTGIRCGANWASHEASAGPGGPRVVPPGTGGGGEVPTLHGSAA